MAREKERETITVKKAHIVVNFIDEPHRGMVVPVNDVVAMLYHEGHTDTAEYFAQKVRLSFDEFKLRKLKKSEEQ